MENPLALIAGGMVIFVAYEGFELIANAAEDMTNPARTLPRAFFGSVLFVIALYILVAIVTVGSLAPDVIAEAQDYALAKAAEPALGHVGFVVVSVSALLATFSAINATVYGNARLGFALAKDGELPEVFERKSWSRPVYGVVLMTVLAILIANLVDLKAIAILGSAGFLLVFAVVNAAAWKLASDIGAARWITIVATIACGAALITLCAHTYQTNPRALLVFAGFLGVALGFEFVYPRIKQRTFRPLRQAVDKLSKRKES